MKNNRRPNAEERRMLNKIRDELEARRQRVRAEALVLPPKPPGCPVCRCWRLREGEERHDDGHASGCAMRGVTRFREVYDGQINGG